jgi:hypothetical protein
MPCREPGAPHLRLRGLVQRLALNNPKTPKTLKPPAPAQTEDPEPMPRPMGELAGPPTRWLLSSSAPLPLRRWRRKVDLCREFMPPQCPPPPHHRHHRAVSREWAGAVSILRKIGVSSTSVHTATPPGGLELEGRTLSPDEFSSNIPSSPPPAATASAPFPPAHARHSGGGLWRAHVHMDKIAQAGRAAGLGTNHWYEHGV